ncbi:LacI family DNA-binding transcriptional regulator [Brachybacterium phenoliresistens]|uniref:LacI family transcriptional regulator n=1 Tax=Brachybacterium phenoliresistens TaxID=396014 RepID=Z9JQV1_9MICO|nr:substrate-binding domain-containing protein [Brachybacterium phenoliresistens]EWS80117.1 LacI family transcriptional regulator [Brachybacterium phenoliresistens]
MTGIDSARVTLRDVATRAEVSLATASKVMNGRADVRDLTRSRVTAAARELGYEARRREGGRPAVSLMIVFRDLTSPYSLHVLDGAVRAAARAGVDLHIALDGDHESLGRTALSRPWLKEVAARGIQGVIAVTRPVDARLARWSAEAGVPVIAVDPETTGDSSLVTISSTNLDGGRAAAEHLLGLGHRRIGVVGGRSASVPARQRLQGYRSALEHAGIPFDRELVRGGSFANEAGRTAAGQLLDLPDPPTAIFAVADSLAVGVLRAARDRGLSVPDRLSVIGFDDTLVATWSNPQLTTMRQPLSSMGQVAVERAAALAADPGRFAMPFKLETRLVVRESTAPPPAR